MMLPSSRGVKAACTVYDCMDEHANFRFAPANLLTLEEELFAAADVVFTGGYSLYEAKRGRHADVHPFPSTVDIAHFADFAEQAARRIGPGGCYVAINAISYLAWAGGEVGYLNPFVHDRGEELKNILCRAAIAATRRIRAVDPRATMVAAEPLIRAHPADDSDAAIERARAMTAVQYDAIDVLLGRRHGAPLGDLLTAAHLHYRRPLLIAETGCEGDDRAGWARYVEREVARAGSAGCPVIGVCFYPILDHPGWDDERHCENGLLCGYSMSPRPVHGPLAAAIGAFPRLESASPSRIDR